MTLSFSRLFFSRLTFLLILTAAGGYFLYNLKSYVKFGIDLVGGTYITLEVQLDKAREAELVEKMQEITELFKNTQQAMPLEKKISDFALTLKFASVKDAQQAATLLMDRLRSMLVEQTGDQVVLRLTPEQIKNIDQEAVKSNIIALNSRVDQFGVGETLVARQGDNRIIIELPNVHNPQEAKAMIGRAALLEIKLVEDSAGSKDALLDKYDGDVPDGMEVLPGKQGRSGGEAYYLVPRYTDITGKLLKTARVGAGGRTGVEPVVIFEFKSLGAKRFYDLTCSNIGQRLAVIIDGVVITAPVVNSAIGGEGIITGDFTSQEAEQLAILLRSGAFVAPVTFEEERTIGPSLGAESIHKGLLACAVGLVLLFFFSVIIYKTSGLLAFIVLLYNLLLVLFVLWMIGATLTLPGIAGMVLTVGMAIDASILVYERIKEELADKVAFREAVNRGFAGAFSVIIDANVTNLLIAIVLYKLGSGPIQGFAVTMIVGMVATLITGLWLLKSFFTFAFDVLGINKLKI
jgi:preprotein translocase subunit SecD